MRDDTVLLNSIPMFLHRPSERAPVKLEIKARTRRVVRPPLPRPEMVIHGGVSPVQPNFGLAAEAEIPPVAPATSDIPRVAAVVAPEARPVTSPMVPAAVPAGRTPARLPWMARRAAQAAKAPTAKAPADAEGHSAVVDLTAHRGAAAHADPSPNQLAAGPRAAFVADHNEAAEDEDVAFQITLPRSVIRQIRMLAAEEGTTHRAIVLRALRTTGLDIPEGADVDRRAIAAKRRHQA